MQNAKCQMQNVAKIPQSLYRPLYRAVVVRYGFVGTGVLDGPLGNGLSGGQSLQETRQINAILYRGGEKECKMQNAKCKMWQKFHNPLGNGLRRGGSRALPYGAMKNGGSIPFAEIGTIACPYYCG